jgi:hypothetical protein
VRRGPELLESTHSIRSRSGDLVGLIVAIGLIVATGIGLGCSSSPERRPQRKPASRVVDELAGAPDWIRRGCAAYWADAPSRGVCGVGSASGSRNIALTTSTAEGRGRTAIARTMSSRVEAMLKDYQATTTGGEEFGTAAGDEQHIVDVAKQLTDGSLAGAERRDLWISPAGVAYALMVLDLEKFQGAVWSMKALSESLRRKVIEGAAEDFSGPMSAPESEDQAGTPETNVAGREEPLVLVTQAEIDAMPGDTSVAWGSEEKGADGPIIEIESPEEGGVYDGPFPIKVEFRNSPAGHAVDMDTLKLEYKVAWGIDITDRVRDFVDGRQIDVAESELPEGRHTVEIQIEDVEGNESSRLFTVTVQ